jgi:1-acyl-sn-glycerol-3-phosphate acyltransferase
VVGLFRWGSPKNIQFFSFLASWGGLKIARVKSVGEGIEHLHQKSPCVFISNHQSAFDLISCGKFYPERTVMIAKKELKYIPIIGLFFSCAGTIFLDRKRGSDARSMLRKVAPELLKKNVCVGFYAEGTRNRSGKGILPFKKGAFMLAIQAQVPLVPFVVSEQEPVGLIERLEMRGGRMIVRILPPYPTVGLTDKDVTLFMEKIRGDMIKASKEISDPHYRPRRTFENFYSEPVLES